MHHKSKPNQNGISINNSGHLMNQLNSLNYTTAHWNWILKCKNISLGFWASQNLPESFSQFIFSLQFTYFFYLNYLAAPK